MANFPGLILTDAGRDILAQAIAGEDLVFTRVALGDGVTPANPQALTALVNEIRNAPIQALQFLGDGTSKVRAIVTNVGVTSGFFAREVGLFATDPDTSTEVLYAYSNSGNQADYIPAEGGATIVEQLFDLITVVDTASSVTAVIDDSIIYATKDEVTGVAIEGPTLVFPGSTNTYTMTNFNSFATYSVSSDIGTATISGDTITLVIDAGQAAGGLNMTVMRDGFPWTFQIAIGAQSVAQTTIENPGDGAIDVGSGVSITTAAFFTYPNGVDTHASTDWQVATDSGFTSIVFESLDDAVNLEAIAVPSGTFNTSTTYYIRARHTGTTLGDGPYSATVSFTTAASFYPSTEVAKLLASDGASNDEFGYSVSISNDYAIIGAYYNDDAGADSGSAYIFERDGAGNWVEVQKLNASDAASSDRFGRSVSISGNYAFVGAPFSAAFNGGVYIFERDASGNWTEMQKITASDASNDYFGFSIGVHADYAIIGAPSDDDAATDSGAAYIFERSGGVWTQIQKLKAIDVGASDNFGWSVGINGNYAAVGSPKNDDAGADSGSAYIFERDGAGNWVQAEKITATDAAAYDDFGQVVSISGNYAIIGAPYDDDAGLTSGSAYIFERDGLGNWQQNEKLLASDGAANDYFGSSVGISGNYAIIGANGDDGAAGSNTGAAYIFERDGSGNWVEVAKLIASDAAVGDQLGWSVAISGNYAIAGANRETNSEGAAYVFE